MMNLNNIQSGVVLTQGPLFTIAGREEPMHRGVYIGILCFYAKLFDQMEIGGILDPLNELHPFCLHHIFLPRFNRSLKELVEQRIERPVSTEHNMSPLQLWTSGMLQNINSLGLLRYRGPRINNRGRNNTRIRPIPTTVNSLADCRQHNGSHIAENLRQTQRSVNFGVLRSVKKLRQPKVYGIPSIISTNVGSLPKKVEETQQIAELNSAGAICITKSWLSTDIPDSCVATGGGVCIYLDQKMPCRLLQSCDQEEV